MSDDPIRDALAEIGDGLDAQAAEWAIQQDQADADHAAEGKADMAWLPGWLCRQDALLTAELETLKRQHRVRVAQVQARQMAMHARWSEQAAAEIQRQLAAQGGKKKSFETDYGRCGLRTVAARDVVVILNEDAATSAAALTCPKAVKTSLLVSEILKHTHETGEELPGTRLERIAAREAIFAGHMVLTPDKGE